MRHSKCVKLSDRRTGWYGDGCWRQRGRAFIKRLEHRYNRRIGHSLERRTDG